MLSGYKCAVHEQRGIPSGSDSSAAVLYSQAIISTSPFGSFLTSWWRRCISSGYSNHQTDGPVPRELLDASLVSFRERWRPRLQVAPAERSRSPLSSRCAEPQARTRCPTSERVFRRCQSDKWSWSPSVQTACSPERSLAHSRTDRLSVSCAPMAAGFSPAPVISTARIATRTSRRARIMHLPEAFQPVVWRGRRNRPLAILCQVPDSARLFSGHVPRLP